jgi:hypothetical protein
MTSSLVPTCPLCGLRYSHRSLLELHLREDHRTRRRPAPGHGGQDRPDGAPASAQDRSPGADRSHAAP